MAKALRMMGFGPRDFRHRSSLNLPWKDARTLYTAVLRRIGSSAPRLIKPPERGVYGATLSRRDYRAQIDLPARSAAKKQFKKSMSWARRGGNIVVLETAMKALST